MIIMACKSKSGISNNRGNWNNLKNTQTIPKQHTRKAQNQGTTKKNQPYWHFILTAGSANVKVQTIFNM